MCPVSETTIQRVFYAARDGMPITLFTILNEQPPEDIQELLTQSHLESDGECTTPLIAASRAGHSKVVRLILCKFRKLVDLEAEGTVRFDGYVIEGATALWCAAAAGHLHIVKFLVSEGADVNHGTQAGSTPARAACFDGRLDVLRFLTSRGADLSKANAYGNTCLMLAAHKGHTDTVEFLLANGLDSKLRAACGASALHFAAEGGHLATVAMLVEQGNSPLDVRNSSGLTALAAAAERTRASIVEYLLTRPGVTNEEVILALELLGASFANDRDNYNAQAAYDYMYRALQMRIDNDIPKKVLPPIEAYNNHRECQTLEELETIQYDFDALQMEGLAIRERVLGSESPELAHAIVYRGAVLADTAEFERSVILWLRALELRRKTGASVARDLLRFAQVFSQMIHVGVRVSAGAVISALAAGAAELATPEDVHICDEEERDHTVRTVLYLLAILARVARGCSTVERVEARRVVRSLSKLRLRDGRTMLHLAVDAGTPVDDFHTRDVCHFPDPFAAELLIRCGADVNAMDADRNTPLHLAADGAGGVAHETRPCRLLAAVLRLTRAGAHADCVNAKGETPAQIALQGPARCILRAHLNLQCLAARALKRHKLSFKGVIHPALEEFVELHGP